MTREKDIKTERDPISPLLNNCEHHLSIASVWQGGKQKLEGPCTRNGARVVLRALSQSLFSSLRSGPLEQCVFDRVFGPSAA